MPPNIAALPIDERGYPVPYFVQWMDEVGNPTKRGSGKPDFRVADSRKVYECIMHGKCWVCGQNIGRKATFVVGPMCVINRGTSEPPSHYACAIWSMKACPFLLNPSARRRDVNLPDGVINPPGEFNPRNPGVMAAYTSRTWLPKPVSNGIMLGIGEPENVEWWTQGRMATKDEAANALEEGYKVLQSVCNDEEEAELLRQFYEAAKTTLP